MSYLTEAQKTISEKITLVTVEAVERLKLFTLNGSDYDRIVDNMVVGVKDSGVALSLGTLPLSLNEWHYEATTKTLTINVGADPKTKDISVTYRLFFSNAPVILPYDLSTGADVEWEPYVSSIGSLGQQLDEENTGIVLESSSSVSFFNSDGRFDGIYDTLIWENQNIRFYSWIASTLIAENSLLFSGVIESKTFSSTAVSFKVKDFVYKLKDKVNTGLFSDTDGTILPSLIGTAKRRIYGQADYVKMASLGATLGGYLATGTATAVISTNSMSGSGTAFLSELSVGDELIFTINGEEEKVAIQSIETDTALTLGKIIDFSVNALPIKVKPHIPSRYKNRTWHLAHHKIKSPSTTITTVISDNRFEVASTADLFAGNEITVNGTTATIRRVSGSEVVTESVISPSPSGGDTITRLPVSAVYFGAKKLTHTRDYTITNTTECKIVLDQLCEFNISEQVGLGTGLLFTNTSRTITTSASVDLRSILKPRDWIRSSSLTEPDWYEILEVKEQTIIIRSAFSGATATKSSYYKNVDYVSEESLLTANCLGREVSGLWIKTASDAVRDLVLNDAGFSSVNETSFTKANADCDYVLSLVIPEDLGKGYPIIRDILSKINESVFGVLFGNSSHLISYSIFNATKPSSLDAIEDDDIISFSASSTQQIINASKINYRPFVDIYSGEAAFETINYASTFVDNLVGIKATTEKTICLYETDKATIIAQRLCFFRSLAQSTVSIKTKLNLANVVVNDKLYLSLDRLFTRYAGADKRRIGVVSGIKKDGYECEISLSDLGNIFNRTMSIAPNSTVDFSAATDDDKVRWGFVVDNSTETCDITSETGLGSNKIG